MKRGTYVPKWGFLHFVIGVRIIVYVHEKKYMTKFSRKVVLSQHTYIIYTIRKYYNNFYIDPANIISFFETKDHKNECEIC